MFLRIVHMKLQYFSTTYLKPHQFSHCIYAWPTSSKTACLLSSLHDLQIWTGSRTCWWFAMLILNIRDISTLDLKYGNECECGINYNNILDRLTVDRPRDSVTQVVIKSEIIRINSDHRYQISQSPGRYKYSEFGVVSVLF